MPDNRRPTLAEMQRSLDDLLEAARRLRAQAKEKSAEASRIISLARKLEKTFEEHIANDSNGTDRD